MAKINKDSLISIELEKISAKVEEFQTYLENKKIAAESDTKSRHEEIEIQIKMQNALFQWLPILENLRSLGMNEEEKEDYRRGTKPAGIAKE